MDLFLMRSFNRLLSDFAPVGRIFSTWTGIFAFILTLTGEGWQEMRLEREEVSDVTL